jgi:hypothetical protein
MGNATTRSPSPLALNDHDPLMTTVNVNWYHCQSQTQSLTSHQSPGSAPGPPSTSPSRHPRRLQCLLDRMPSPTDDETPFPSLDHSTLHGFGRSHLSPDDAFVSPPRGPRGRSRRRKRPWKKLMWVKQSCMCTLDAPEETMPANTYIPKILITTPTKRPFSKTSSATLASSRMTSGLLSPILPSYCSMCALSSYSLFVLLA